MSSTQKNPNTNPSEKQYGEGVDTPDGIDLTIAANKSGDYDSNFMTVNNGLLVLAGCVVVAAAAFFFNYSGDWNSGIYNQLAHYSEGGGGSTKTPYEIGEKLFAKQCAQCHQATGLGVPGAFPPLVDSSWVLGSKERLVNILLSGLAGPIEVNGSQYNGNMPPFGGQFDDDEIAAVITYIRTQSDWGQSGTEVTTEEVTAVKSEYGVRAQAWSADELLKLFPDE